MTYSELLTADFTKIEKEQLAVTYWPDEPVDIASVAVTKYLEQETDPGNTLRYRFTSEDVASELHGIRLLWK